MAIFKLGAKPVFPNPELAEPIGVLAFGGDLSVPRLLEAYRNGIFPWFEPGEELLWWCPDPRLVLEFDELKISRSLRATIRKRTFEIRFDTAFERVIHHCGVVRRREGVGSWITAEIERSYTTLHRLGFAHSVESWHRGELAGGLYGVALGRCFFGESMFSLQSDASKVALVALVDELKRREFELLDCQVNTDHLVSLGAREITRKEFLSRLKHALRHPNDTARWVAHRRDSSEG